MKIKNCSQKIGYHNPSQTGSQSTWPGLLPNELFLLILSFLDIRTLVACAAVCHTWNNKIIEENQIWLTQLAHFLIKLKVSNPTALISFAKNNGSAHVILKTLYQNEKMIEFYTAQLKKNTNNQSIKKNSIPNPGLATIRAHCWFSSLYLPEISYFLVELYDKIYSKYVKNKLEKCININKKIIESGYYELDKSVAPIRTPAI